MARVQEESVSSAKHVFQAIAFVENFTLDELVALFGDARRRPHFVRKSLAPGGVVFGYPFGAIVFLDASAETRDEEVRRLHQVRPTLSEAVVREELRVREVPGAKPEVVGGTLILGAFDDERAGVIAHTVAQSAALEYYERIVEQMFVRTGELVGRLERDGTVPFRTRPLHRFIGAALDTRNEVLAVLHLLDKPDETWDDPETNRIYEELRAEFDLLDRFQALETKLRSVQEALELILDVARDRRLVLLEVAIVALIVIEVVIGFVR
jgi:uncharacterized Rmd1/YagE family protein